MKISSLILLPFGIRYITIILLTEREDNQKIDNITIIVSIKIKKRIFWEHTKKLKNTHSSFIA